MEVDDEGNVYIKGIGGYDGTNPDPSGSKPNTLQYQVKKRDNMSKLVVGHSIPIKARMRYSYASEFIRISRRQSSMDFDLSSFKAAGCAFYITPDGGVTPLDPTWLGLEEVPETLTAQYWKDNPGVENVMIWLKTSSVVINHRMIVNIIGRSKREHLVWSDLLIEDNNSNELLQTASPNLKLKGSTVVVTKASAYVPTDDRGRLMVDHSGFGMNLRIYYTRPHFVGGSRIYDKSTGEPLQYPRKGVMKRMALKNFPVKYFNKHFTKKRGRMCHIELWKQFKGKYWYKAQEASVNLRKTEVLV